MFVSYHKELFLDRTLMSYAPQKLLELPKFRLRNMRVWTEDPMAFTKSI